MDVLCALVVVGLFMVLFLLVFGIAVTEMANQRRSMAGRVHSQARRIEHETLAEMEHLAEALNNSIADTTQHLQKRRH